MKLLSSAASPFVRKVRIVAAACGLDPRIELVAADPWASPELLTGANPLSRIPCLITDDGVALYDSPVICEYLDHLGQGGLFAPPGPLRWRALVLQALGDGMLDAAVLRRREEMRAPEPERAAVIARQAQVVARGLDRLEAEVPAEHLDIGTITIGCALGYLDFRFAAEGWRTGRPRLAAWAGRIMVRPEFAATAPPPA